MLEEFVLFCLLVVCRDGRERTRQRKLPRRFQLQWFRVSDLGPRLAIVGFRV